MSTVSSADTKNLRLVCHRCKKETEDLDCLYNIYVEVKGVVGSSNEDVLEDFEYTVCGTCQDEIERYIGIHAMQSARKFTG